MVYIPHATPYQLPVCGHLLISCCVGNGGGWKEHQAGTAAMSVCVCACVCMCVSIIFKTKGRQNQNQSIKYLSKIAFVIMINFIFVVFLRSKDYVRL